MGKIRTKLIGLETEEEKQKLDAKVRREQKKKREGEKLPKEKLTHKKEETPSEEPVALDKKPKKTKRKVSLPVQTEGRRYREAKATIKNPTYDIISAVDLLKSMPHASFDETVELHLNVKENGIKGEVKLPFETGAKKKRVVVLDDEVLGQIEAGKIDFDLLIAHPSLMSKLVKHARVLGPKGLMPNPKNGTLTTDVEKAKAKFISVDTIRFTTELKAPLIHQTVGKVSFDGEKLVANIQAFIASIQPSRIYSVFLTSTMSPSIKIHLEKS